MTGRPPLLLSFDFEDWHQLVRRRIGVSNWEEPGPALERQTQAVLDLLDRLHVKATFFILGVAARAHPRLVKAIANRGHEIGCHGDEHVAVYLQTADQFAADLKAARTTIERLTGTSPVGYRAPAFSITRGCPWAYQVLAEHGFAYDTSQYDSPRIPDRPTIGTAPHQLSESLWEFPIAVWRTRAAKIPLGGPSYWAALPPSVVLRGLQDVGPLAGLYLHPYELDPEPLRADVMGVGFKQRVHGRLRALHRNVTRRGAQATLEKIAERFSLIPYGEAHASLSAGPRPQPIQG